MRETNFKNPGIVAATTNAWNGIQALIHEKSARRELVLALFCAILFYIDTNPYTLALLVLTLLLLALESINTALEEICDHVTPEYHPRIKKIKDLGGASVLISVIAIIAVAANYPMNSTFGPAFIEQKLTQIAGKIQPNLSKYIFYSAALYLSLYFWKRGNRGLAIASSASASLWLLYQASITNLLTSLGSDSIQELSDFDPDEALFFISTLPETIRIRMSLKQYAMNVIASILIVCVSIIGSRFLLRWELR